MAKKKFYAIKKGIKPGIYRSWPEAEAQVKGFPGAQYKGFATEAEASQWLTDGSEASPGKRDQKKSSTLAMPKVGKGEVVVGTDGGAIGNPGPGGYGVVILYEDGKKELTGGYRLTTNNRMELMACIVALEELQGASEKITLFSDSSYVVNGMVKGWVRIWQKNGWLKADKKPVLNQDLWQKLLELSAPLTLEFKWVKGHAGNPLNERCDTLAVQSAKGKKLQIDTGYENS